MQSICRAKAAVSIHLQNILQYTRPLYKPAQHNKCPLGSSIFADEPLKKMIKNPCFFVNTKDT